VISHHVWWIIIDLRLVSPGCVLFLARALDMWGGEGYQYLWIGSTLVEYSVCLADVIHEERFSPSWWSFVGIKTGTLLRINNTHVRGVEHRFPWDNNTGSIPSHHRKR